MKKFFYLLCLLLSVSGCSFFDKKTGKPQLVVGTNPFMPYMFINDDNAYDGFDIELAQELARRLGRELVVKNISFDALIIELMQGKIDLIMGGFSITKDREEKMLMIHYAGKKKESLPLVFWEKIPTGVMKIEDLALLNNRTICVQPGSLQEDLFSRYSFIDLKRLDSISDMLMEIRYGKSIACALEHEVTASLQKRSAQIKTLSVALPDDLQDKGVGIALRKDNKELFEKINQLIQVLKKDGTIEALEKKWFNRGGPHD